MLESNGVFKIDTGLSHNELKKVHKNIVKDIKSIKTIEISQENELKSSALLSLLKTIKLSKPNISIPIIDDQKGEINGLGCFVIVNNNSKT